MQGKRFAGLCGLKMRKMAADSHLLTTGLDHEVFFAQASFFIMAELGHVLENHYRGELAGDGLYMVADNRAVRGRAVPRSTPC